MPSMHFENLQACVTDLKKIYLNDGVFTALPSLEAQELARGFVAFLHAELEQYVEEAFRELALCAMSGVAVGILSRVAVSLLVFSGVPPQTGGSRLRMPISGGSSGNAPAKKEKTPRLLATRYGEAHGRYVEMLNSNNGVREKYLAGLGIPIGLDAQRVDPNWIKDLEAICSSRGAWVHMSRTNGAAKLNEIDPKDIWVTCQRLIWGIGGVSSPGVISSFKDLDQWVEDEKNLIGQPLINEPKWKFKVYYAISMLWCYWKRRNDKDKLNGED